MGPDMSLYAPRVGNPNFSPSPVSKTAKSAAGLATILGTAATAPNPAPGRTARGKNLFRYFSTFLTYLVKIADDLIRIMSNSGAPKQRSDTARQSCCAKPGSLCQALLPAPQ